MEPQDLGRDYAVLVGPDILRLRFLQKKVTRIPKWIGPEHSQMTYKEIVEFVFFDPSTDTRHSVQKSDVLWEWKDHVRIVRATEHLGIGLAPEQRFLLAGRHQWGVEPKAWSKAASRIAASGPGAVYLGGRMRPTKRFPWERPKWWFSLQHMVRLGTLLEAADGGSETDDDPTVAAEATVPTVIGLPLPTAENLLEGAGWQVASYGVDDQSIWRPERWVVKQQLVAKHDPPEVYVYCSKP